MRLATSRPNQEALDRAVAYFDEAKKHHRAFVTKVEENYKSYRGIIEEGTQAAQWTSKAHPPYINHIVETTLASLVDDELRYQIRPRPNIEMLLDPNAAARAVEGAKLHQALWDWQIKRDGFSYIQRPFVLQNAIAGMTVAKTFWTEKSERRRKMVPQQEPLTGPDGTPMTDPMGQPIMTTTLKEQTAVSVVYDGPTTEVRDVRDFLWHESAVSVDKARYVIDRVWLTLEEIEQAVSDGTMGPDAGGWSIAEVKKALGEGKDFKDDLAYREQELWSIDRTKDLIEVLEVWDQVERDRIVVANRKALLGFGDFPFFHAGPPFVVCSTQPDLFRIPGISQVEKVLHLQNLLWSVMNQRIDNLKLINNAIFWFRPDIEDPDEYEFEPGARWPVEDPAQVQMWAPQVIPAEVSLGAESIIKGDLQNLAGGFPFTSSTESQTVDQKTATGASIVTNIAQRSINLAKTEVYRAWEQVGYQRMVLNQQFIREVTVAPLIGLDGQREFQLILPELLAGDYDFILEPISDTLMKQEEQASANALMQLALATMPVMIPLAQAGQGKVLNLQAFVEDLLRAYDKEDTDRYFSRFTPPPMAGMPGQQQGTPPANGQVPQPGQPNPVGITGPNSINPAVSPGAQVSNSPITNLQRSLALSNGGGTNVG